MANKSTKDPNLFAKRVFENLLDKLDPEAAADLKPEAESKNPKRQAVGRKGGTIRAKKLPAEERTVIARKAAIARWKKTT